MKALGIVGSPHKDGNTVYLLREVFKVLSGKFEVETVFLKDYVIKPCEGCCYCEESGKCVLEDDMQKLCLKLREADVVILSSPSYMGGVTSRLKAFMERTWYLRKGQLEGKIGTYIVVGRRRIGVAVNEIEEYLSRLGMVKIPGVSGYAFKKGEILEDREALKEAKRLGRQILRLCGKTGF